MYCVTLPIYFFMTVIVVLKLIKLISGQQIAHHGCGPRCCVTVSNGWMCVPACGSFVKGNTEIKVCIFKCKYRERMWKSQDFKIFMNS